MGTGIGRAIKNNPVKSLLPPLGIIVEGQKERKKSDARSKASKLSEEQRRTAEQQEKIAEEQKKAAIAEESVRLQKEKARRKTIFAGQDIQQGVFRRTLGG